MSRAIFEFIILSCWVASVIIYAAAWHTPANPETRATGQSRGAVAMSDR